MRLKELVLVTFVASALVLLDGELFYLSLLHGEYGTSVSALLPASFAAYVGSLGSILSLSLYNLFQEGGVFAIYLLSLCTGSILYLKVLERFSKDKVLSFLLVIWGTIGVVSSIRDLSTALAFAVSGAELLVLTGARSRLLFVPLFLIHLGIDSSFFLPIAIYLLSQGTVKGSILGILLLLNSALVVTQGRADSLYSLSTSILALALGLVLAIKNQKPSLIIYSLIVPAIYYSLEAVAGLRFPAGSYYPPIVVAVIWASADAAAKSRFSESLRKLENSFNNFLTTKNRMALVWLCLAFIFFQTAAKFFHPVKDAYLPTEAMDVLAESRPKKPPLHPIEIGGYVGFRLAPLLKPGASLNLIDLSSKTLTSALYSESYRQIWRGENQELFTSLDPDNVLCQGADKLCVNLKNDSQWKILSRSTIGDRILEKLRNLTPKQKEIVSRKLEEESWYLFGREG